MTKEQLKGLSALERGINGKLDDLERLRSLAERTTTLMTGMPRGGGQQDRYNSIICRIWAIEKELDADIDAYVDTHKAISDALDGIADDRERLVLRMRYLNCWSWGKIVQEMREPERTIYWLHGQALKNVLTLQ